MYFRDECFAKGTKNSWKEKDEIQGGSSKEVKSEKNGRAFLSLEENIQKNDIFFFSGKVKENGTEKTDSIVVNQYLCIDRVEPFST